MEMKWPFFAGAAILADYFLLSGGAPPIAVAAGTALAGVATYLKRK
jgi:hypothetical protein